MSIEPEIDLHSYIASHSTPTNPKGACIFIGDTHAQLLKVQSLLTNIQNYIVININQEAWDNATFVFLGDYVDRGKYAKEMIEFLSSIQETKAENQSFYFLLGNHDFALMSFLELIPKPTKAENPEPYDLSYYIQRGDRFWKPKDPKDKEYAANNEILAQGYRYLFNFSTRRTFASYDVPFGNKVDFMEKMPEKHKQFYRSLDWIRILNIPNRGYGICVHGGFLPSTPIILQMEDLFNQKLHECIKQLCYRREVAEPPKEIIANDICLISGHHSIFKVGPSRLIVDTCAGFDENKLSGVILPPSTNQVESFLDGYVVIESSD